MNQEQSPEHRGITNKGARLGWGSLLVLILQIILLFGATRVYNIEGTRGFGDLFALVLVGFPLHSMMPPRYRSAFFILLTFVGVFLLLGLANGAWLIALALFMFGLCHLPVSYRLRVVVLVISALALGALRGFWIQNSVPFVIWPILGSIFMFRTIIYLYDSRHEKKPAPLAQRLSYFFLPPNIFFPFFPIVDYSTFLKSYYNDASYRIYQKGINWMCLGVAHLLVYRLVYYNFTVPVEVVSDVGTLTQFLVSNYLLYLRVSGQFHIIAGICCLFGYNLPRTHNLFYLASGFNDLWRRINIYWKDFVTKCFYYPMFMRLRSRGMVTAMVTATVYVFVCTWLLHIYQWFWLRGSVTINAQEAIFWFSIGACVVVNSLYEYKYGRSHRAAGRKKGPYSRMLLISLRTGVMFLTMSVFWSLFTATSLHEWLSVWHLDEQEGMRGLSVLLAVFSAVALAAFSVQLLKHKGGASGLPGAAWIGRRPAVPVVSFLVVILLAGYLPTFGTAAGEADKIMISLKATRLSARDNHRLVMGYYEGLVNVNQFRAPVVFRTNRPPDWVTWEGFELKPLDEFTHKGVLIRTNRWAMRDRDYEKEKAVGTLRIAMIGGSHLFGSGVEAEELYESLLEERLNNEHSAGPYGKYEVLNFAKGGHSALERYGTLKDTVFDFDPDFVFYIAHSNDRKMVRDRIAHSTSRGVELPYAELKAIVDESGVEADTPLPVIKKLLDPRSEEILSWIYAEIIKECTARGVVPVLVYQPLTYEAAPGARGERELILRLALQAGFVVLNLQDTYLGYSQDELWVKPWDGHPSPFAHALLEERLYEELLKAEGELHLGLALDEGPDD